MRTFHFIVQLTLAKFDFLIDHPSETSTEGKNTISISVNNRLEHELHRKTRSSRRFRTEYSYPGIWKLADEKRGIIVLGGPDMLSELSIKHVEEAFKSGSTAMINTSLEAKEIRSIRPITYDPNLPDRSMDPKEFGQKKLGKRKKK